MISSIPNRNKKLNSNNKKKTKKLRENEELNNYILKAGSIVGVQWM